jgi:hypothetical protein
MHMETNREIHKSFVSTFYLSILTNIKLGYVLETHVH